ncbi:hypothetical protein Asn12ST33_10230 [Cutibacterium acnes]|nr:hypothetical protein Asn12ST33_10230 [Cutibacterium acnes]HAP96874.1 hypothetical protein [Cutibacterium acnes]
MPVVSRFHCRASRDGGHKRCQLCCTLAPITAISTVGSAQKRSQCHASPSGELGGDNAIGRPFDVFSPQ